ncbi:TrkH family potassium uptake protein [Marinospirillum alkaliphilum]|uniref:Trk system potassium uptake protein n=1 Tax=Marinospirillum alkaliphilum DSM 21637 TaxID=1122209 RepID=A0A1K1UFD6_9GAMM|nr:TrkH family potassium uptake protein [Marinospirillum alkaliphilum]SFX11506.1 trk system potassium uptake protein TrkH [Marinospirillum alkaliphilum DSM 21637]
MQATSSRHTIPKTESRSSRRQQVSPLRHWFEWLAPIIKLLGLLLLLLGAFKLAPIILLSIEGQQGDMQIFFYSMAITLVSGGLMVVVGSLAPFNLRGRQIFLLTSLSWLVLSLFSSIPLLFGSTDLSISDAVFETVSGLTTTGATILSGLDTMSHGILLWRAILQWLGGIGIIVMGMAILPFLQVGGMRLFQSESSDWSEKAMPRSGTLAKAIGKVYVGLTLLCVFSYWLAGMNLFDAVVHGMTTSATGGFANYDASMGHFADTPSILWISILFMFLGALPFVLFVHLIQGRPMPMLMDSQVQALFKILISAVGILTLYLMTQQGWDWFEALTHATFNIVSVVTTTGYASSDYNAWGNFAVIFFLYLMFIGGCSGSTSGGFKVFRHQLSLMLMRNQMMTLLHPRGVFSQRYNGKPVPDDVIRSMVAFAFFFFATIAALALALSFMGLDFITSFTAAVTAVANVGPGLGDTVGPAGNFSSLPDAGKWLMCLGMILGRLEIVTFMILFTRAFWRA